MQRVVGLALSVWMVLGCRPEAVEGEPCSEGDPPHLTCRVDVPDCILTARLVLDCGAPPGCAGDEPFTWRMSGGGNRTWCGCDGVTRSSDYSRSDYGSIPTTRWQHFGSCTEPCEEVGWYGGEWVWRPDAWRETPVAEECADCRDAMLVESRCVDGPSGRLRPRECCDCASAALVDGVCIDEVEGYEIASSCCS